MTPLTRASVGLEPTRSGRCPAHTTDLSATPPGPACPSRGSGWRVPRHRRGFPCCAPYPPPCVPPPLPSELAQRAEPRRNRSVHGSLTCRTVPAFPVRQAGRLPHHNVSRPAQRFTRVAARMVAEPPLATRAIRVLQPRSLPPSAAPTATGWSDSCRAGIALASTLRRRRTAPVSWARRSISALGNNVVNVSRIPIHLCRATAVLLIG